MAGKGEKASVVAYEGERLDDAADVLARAFETDPVFSWLTSHLDPTKRMVALHEIMETLTRALFAPHGESYLALPSGAKSGRKEEGKVNGVMLLHPPLVQESFLAYLKHGIHRLPIIVGGRGLIKIFPPLYRSTLVKEAVMADSLHDRGFWYVGFLGVDPDCQGQGIGSILLQSVIDKADKEDLQVYLETANERNVPWYEKFGFVVIYKEKAGFVGPMVWYLRREAKSLDAETKMQLAAKAKKRVEDLNKSLKRGLLVALAVLVGLFLVYFYLF